MCGINGIISNESLKDISYRIDKMNTSIIHRGPDSGNYVVHDSRVALGHRRLSIIDTRSISDQPMTSNDDRVELVFNGEIYNFNELKEKLSYKFQTESDTEVIIASYLEYGIDWFLRNANGMFSIGLFDKQLEKLFCARDRMGIKPFYYFAQHSKFIFSSEIKGILNSGLVDAELNEFAIDEYLGNRYVRAPFTFFKDIYQLSPGHLLEFDVKRDEIIRLEKYWEIPSDFNRESTWDEDSIINKLDKELNKSIKYREE